MNLELSNYKSRKFKLNINLNFGLTRNVQKIKMLRTDTDNSNFNKFFFPVNSINFFLILIQIFGDPKNWTSDNWCFTVLKIEGTLL